MMRTDIELQFLVRLDFLFFVKDPYTTTLQVQRVTLRRRHAYATKSNKIKIVKTPGGKLAVHYQRKVVGGPKCGGCGNGLSGV